MAATFTGTYRVTSLNESGDRIIVNLAQDFSDQENGGLLYQSPLSLNLTKEEAANYFPGQTYKVTLTAA